MTNRRSTGEWSTSGYVVESGSSKPVAASLKSTTVLLEMSRCLPGIPQKDHDRSIAAAVSSRSIVDRIRGPIRTPRRQSPGGYEPDSWAS